jgi:signal peptidase I
MPRGRLLRLTAGAVGIAALVGAWFLVAPRALGGRLSYVVVARGTSMEPAFHTGDLALVRPADTYSPGQVVAYRSRDLGSTVLHRIVERDGNGYVLKGDNNDFLDPEHPTDDDILGALWIRVPVVGSVMSWFRQPANAAMVAGGAVFLAVAFAEGRRRRSHRGRHVLSTSAERLSSGASARNGLGVAAIASAVFLLLAVISFSRPSTTVRTEEVSYRHTGAFSYEAEVAAGPVYPDGVVRTGDPVFLRLVDAIDVTYVYTLESEEAGGVKGRAGLFVEISIPNGWTRSLELQPETAFTGPMFAARGRLDVRALRRLVRSVEGATGVIPDAYTVRLGADVGVEGALSEEPVDTRFNPRVALRLDALQLQVVPSESGRDPFRSVAKGSVSRGVEIPNKASLLGVGISIAAARLVAMGGTVVSLLLLAFFALGTARGLRGGEASRIHARYGAGLVRVGTIESAVPVADTNTFEDLLRVADRADRMILYEERNGTHTYAVEDGGILLRYRIEDEELAPPPAEEEAEEPEESEEPAVPAPSPEPEEPEMIDAEIAQVLTAQDEVPDEVEEAPAPTHSITWSDSWAVGPARKR